MEKKVSTFNEETNLLLDEINCQLNRRARLAQEKRKLAEGEAMGIVIGEEKGRLALAKSVLKTFMKTYPDEDTAFLDNLTLEQYEKITDVVIEDASLDEIKKSIE